MTSAVAPPTHAASAVVPPLPGASHDELYRHARIYDVAFAYRDFDTELSFLLACARHCGTTPTSFLEVAAGPGVHALCAAKRGIAAAALDLSPSMMALCAQKADAAGVQVRTYVADMAWFSVDTPVDLAFNPLTSISYLTSFDALLRHMQAMARALAPGGVYVVENNHPKDFLRGEHFVPSVWSMREGALSVTTTWIASAPPRIDSARQLYEAVARYEVDDAGVQTRIEDKAWLRMTFPAEIAAAGALAGLEIVAELGDLDLAVPLDDRGWRAVSVLRKPL